MENNKFIPRQILNLIFFVIVILTCVHLQTTVWYSFFGYFPSPSFWMPVFVYLMMNRRFPYNLIWLIFFFLTFLTETAVTPTILLFTLLTLWTLIMFFQKRFSTLSMADFIFVTSTAAFLFPILIFLFSMSAFASPHMDILMNFLNFLLTLPVTPPILLILKTVDGFLSPDPDQDKLVIHL